MSLASRSATAVKWAALANLIAIVVLVVRSILLARWLAVDTFGVYAGAQALVSVTVVAAAFGMGGAFVYHTAETADEDAAAAVHFTLKLLFTLIWIGLMLAGAFLWADGPYRTALVVLTLANGVRQLAQTPRLIYQRRVDQRRTAVIDSTSMVVGSLLALGLAWRGAELGALLAVDVAAAVVTILLFYCFRPVWVPRLSWQPDRVRYFLRFGRQHLSAVALWQALDRIDDLWTQFFLGPTALGYYSRAYHFATYPRLLLAQPVNSVTLGTYAALDAHRDRLGRAFEQTNGLLIRAGFFIAGMMALAAPEFIRLFLGEKWLPMLDAFRLMLVFTMLDPIKLTVANLFVAVGEPNKVTRARLLQLAVLLVGLFALGLPFGITGVALAVDIMLVVGIVVLFWLARPFVPFSLRAIFAVPTLALAAGLLLAIGVLAVWGDAVSGDWLTGGLKLFAFGVPYTAVLFLFERRQTLALLKRGSRGLGKRKRNAENAEEAQRAAEDGDGG